jgi:hypothetical protein
LEALRKKSSAEGFLILFREMKVHITAGLEAKRFALALNP